MRIGEMNNAVETINAWSQTWTDSIVAILWQSTALVVFVAVVALALRRASPSAPLNITPGTSPAWYERLRNFTWRGWLFVMWATVVTLQVLRLFWQRIRLT